MQYNESEATQGICPPGWHMPTYEEYVTLVYDINVNADGNKLKAIGQGSGSGAGTNTSGLSALLAGYGTNEGNFIDLDDFAYFWSSTGYNTRDAYFLSLAHYNNTIDLNYAFKGASYSVRCLKD